MKRPLSVRSCLLILLLLAISPVMFVLGRYTAKNDIKAAYHLSHCTIGDSWSVCHDGITNEEKESIKHYVDEVIPHG